MTDDHKRKSPLAKAAQLPSVERSLEDFVARANEQIVNVAPFDPKVRENALQLEVAALQQRLRGRRRSHLLIALGGFALGAAAMFAINVATSRSNTPATQATAAPPPATVATTPPPPLPPPPPPRPIVTPLPAEPTVAAPESPTPPPPITTTTAARPPKPKLITKPTPATPPTKPQDPGLVDPF